MFIQGAVLAPEGGAGGSGGGSGATPPGFTAEQEDKIQQITAGIVNNALTARFKTFEKSFGEKLESSLGTILEKKLEGFKPKAADDEPKPGKGKDDVHLKTLEAQILSLKQETEAQTRRANDERAKSRNIALRNKLAEELGKHQITDPIKQRHALALLVDSERRVSFEDDESDRLVFNNDDGPVDLTTGLRSWVKTDDGKHFLPPTGAKGSGSRPGGSTPNGAPNKEEAMADFWNGLAQTLKT